MPLVGTFRIDFELSSVADSLGLPPEASAWSNDAILAAFWQEQAVQQQKFLAFASGLHARLGCASPVALLEDLLVKFILDLLDFSSS